jgi:cellulose biosynthesis protein BcsQ
LKILAFNSTKGGVGKTATAVNVAYLATLDKLRVLLWDMDIQSSASFYFRIESKLKGNPEDIFKEGKFIYKNVKKSNYDNLDIIPSDFSFKDLDIIINETKKVKKKFTTILENLENEYDIIIFDCPASFNLISEYILKVSDLILVPIIPTTLSIRAYEILINYINENINKDVLIYAFFTMVDYRKKMHKKIVAEFPQMSKHCLTTTIPYSSTIERMGEFRAPVTTFSSNSRADRALKNLWLEVKNLLNI